MYLCEYISGEPNLGKSVEMENMATDPTNYYKPEWVDLSDVAVLKIRPDPVSDFFKKHIQDLINSS